ncbi:MAG TPA: hypothetical protein VHQ24_13725 [Lachnospiraceae bacterium]|nr:hypothetical protein [Lachnospiraceae bacterium]
MQCNLLYANEENSTSKIIYGASELVRDLKMEILFDSMAQGDSNIKSFCRRILLSPSRNVEEIYMRQEVLLDGIRLDNFFSSIYTIAREAIEKGDTYKEASNPRYDRTVTVAKKVIMHCEIAGVYVEHLVQLQEQIHANNSKVVSPKLREFCMEVLQEYPLGYLDRIERVLSELTFLKMDSQVVVGGVVGRGFKLADIHLKPYKERDSSQSNWLRGRNRKKDKETVIPIDNIVLINNTQELTDCGLLGLSRILSEFNDKCYTFLERVREMFAFYVGSIRMYHTCKRGDGSNGICFPTFSNDNILQFSNLKDTGLLLKGNGKVAGNSNEFRNMKLCVITGLNQGGKTTFLRSIGLAQLMAQCGLFVTATSFTSHICKGIYSHFPNDEDDKLRKGLLEQELHSLDQLITHMETGSLLLMNETFSTTTEYDASYLANQVTNAFYHSNIVTFFVTHLYEYAHELFESQLENTVLLRAHKSSDGSRTYQLEEGEPLRSSSAVDLYHEIIS